MIERRLAEGHDLLAIHRHLIQPALYCIGDKWRNNQISVAQEHLATAMALSVMAHGLARSPSPPARGNKVLLACVQGNHHAVGLQMVSDAFTLAGWQVNFLGANVPMDVLLDHARQWRPDLLGLSASLPEHVSGLREFVGRLKLAMGDQCPHVLVGGLGFTHAGTGVACCEDIDWVADPAAAVSAGERLCAREAVC